MKKNTKNNNKKNSPTEIVNKLRDALYNYNSKNTKNIINEILDSNCVVNWCYPFETITGKKFFGEIIKPLANAMPDFERRDWIVMEGKTEHNDFWVGCGGIYCGTFVKPYLDIQPTGHLAHIRFHEFYKIRNGKITETQAIWDIPELMMQANAWPMSPSLGREWNIPSPATQDGIKNSSGEEQKNKQNVRVITDMLTAMKRHPTEPPKAMQMNKFWHKKMNWYGPAGIGTGRGIQGFRDWHQIPFLNAMPDRGKYVNKVKYHFFANDDYVAVTGWPNMIQTITNDGWLGIAPTNKKITMRSLDFWRLENGKIRENWVMVDLLHMYKQINVDVLARMREFNKAKDKTK